MGTCTRPRGGGTPPTRTPWNQPPVFPAPPIHLGTHVSPASAAPGRRVLMLTQGGWASLTPTAPDSGSNSPPKAGVDRILVTAYRELAGAAGSEEGPGSLAEQQQACGAHWAPPQLPPVSARWPPQGPQVSPGARTVEVSSTHARHGQERRAQAWWTRVPGCPDRVAQSRQLEIPERVLSGPAGEKPLI